MIAAITRLSFTLLAVTGFLIGCAREPTVLDPPFGQSVRQMIAVQTADPSSSSYGLDGTKAINALEAYRAQSGPLEDLGEIGGIEGN